MTQIALELHEPFPSERLEVLYRHCIEGQWCLERAVDWSSLHLERVPTSARRLMASVYSDTLYAERLGTELVRRTHEELPAGWPRRFATVQVKDELRHVEFFERVVHKLGGADDDDVAEELVELKRELADVREHAELMLHTYVLECGARALFVGNAMHSLDVLKRGVRLPGSDSVATLMHAIVELVGRDEARHIAAGLSCLRPHLSALPGPELHALEARARVTARLMVGSLLRRARIFERLGLPTDEMVERVWGGVRTQLARLNLDVGDWAHPTE